MHLANKYVVITGASSGIGEALALHLAGLKCRLVLAARSVAKLEQLRQQCLRQSPEVHVVALDLEDKAQIDEAAGKIKQLVPHVDLLINNAGISQRASAAETKSEVEETIMQVNYHGPIRFTKQLMPHLAKPSCITIISSMVGLFGFRLRSSYAASKHALHGYFESMSLESNDPHILIVCPGRVNTPISFSALHGGGQKHNQADAMQAKGIPADLCAKKIVGAIERRRNMVIIAREERLLWWMRRISPSLFRYVSKRVSPT